MKSHSIESSFCFTLTVVSNVFVCTLLPSTLTHVQNIALSHFLSRVLVSVCFRPQWSNCIQMVVKLWTRSHVHLVPCVSSVSCFFTSVSWQTLLLSDALSLQLLQDVVQVARVGVTMAREVGAKLRLVVHLVPDDGVWLASRAGRAHREDEPAIPRYQKEPQNLNHRRGKLQLHHKIWLVSSGLETWWTSNHTTHQAAKRNFGLPCVPFHCQGGSSAWGTHGQWRVCLDLGALGPKPPEIKVHHIT